MSKSRENIPFLLLLAAVAVSIPLVLGFLGAVHPALDTFSHFRAHLAVLMIVLALPLLFTKMRREGAMLLLFAIMALSTTLGMARDFLSGSAGATTAETTGPRYSLVQINLREDNPEPKRILQMIAREKPDIIAYQEASEQWTKWLDILQATYPYRLSCREDSRTWGVGILSRRPFVEGGQPVCIGDGLLAIAPVDLGGTHINVASLHFSWPWPRWQPYQLGYIEPGLNQLAGPTIIAGDLNAVPWSNAVRRVEAASKTTHMTGIGGTWFPSFLPVSLAPYLGLPIDQIFTSADVVSPKVSAREDAGSDHLPVRLDFSVPAPVRPDEDEPETQSVMLQ
ncbi:endonuclease/exonuclease/phosphatase family protein [Brucella haematophila]|uniref:endonuclease/exonuclease/phosphatase family protein n=1 Tax=Brucella haematophila TaxID=419474 RepID=UPI00110F632D|nr:endonuclease/exonuclease/phosphatase family protein [Brucella haematophila]TMV01538.1 endonuclease [Brucella haematophila]